MEQLYEQQTTSCALFRACLRGTLAATPLSISQLSATTSRRRCTWWISRLIRRLNLNTRETSSISVSMNDLRWKQAQMRRSSIGSDRLHARSPSHTVTTPSHAPLLMQMRCQAVSNFDYAIFSMLLPPSITSQCFIQPYRRPICVICCLSDTLEKRREYVPASEREDKCQQVDSKTSNDRWGEMQNVLSK